MSKSLKGKASEKFLNAVESGQILTFVLDKETFGIDILRVREIRGWQAVTPIPESQSHILGVLHIRGVIVPVIDLRRRMAMQRAENTATTVIIVVSIHFHAGSSQATRHDVGLVVDSVSDVVNLQSDTIQPMPAVCADMRANYIRGISTADAGMVMLVDIDEFFSDDAILAT